MADIIRLEQFYSTAYQCVCNENTLSKDSTKRHWRTNIILHNKVIQCEVYFK